MPLKWSFTEEDCYQCMVLSITFSTFHKSDIFSTLSLRTRLNWGAMSSRVGGSRGYLLGIILFSYRLSWEYWCHWSVFYCFPSYMRVIRDKYHPCSEWILWIVVKSILTDVCRNGIIPLITFLSHIDLWIIASPRPPPLAHCNAIFLCSPWCVTMIIQKFKY